MTEQELDDLIEYDTERWTREGVSPALIAQRNAANRRYFRNSESPFAQAAARFANKISGNAPGTPIGATPVVIEGTATTCQTCKGFEWIIDANGNTKPCPTCGESKIAERRAASVDRHSSKNGRAAGQTFKNFTVPATLSIRERASLKTCVDEAMKFALDPQGWLILHGTTGNGKSHLAAAVYNALKTRSKPTIYSTAPEILDSLRELFDDERAKAEGTTYAQRLDTYKTVPVLIVDDFGADYGKDWREGVWFELLDARYRNRLPTLFTMNMSPADESLGFRLRSRLQDTHDDFVAIVHNAAPDFRIQ